jgi:AcrR family transcriptional regulator
MPAPRSDAPTSRRRARRGEGDRLRREILAATADLLVEHGRADKVSTRAVAERVGCSSPALYLHFPDKASLIYAACEEQFRQLGTLIAEAMADQHEPLARLRVAAHTYTRYALDHPVQYRIMMLDDETGPGFERSLAELGAETGLDAIVTTIAEAMARGDLAPDDPVLVAVTVWATFHGLVSLALFKPGIALPPTDELVDRVVTQCLDGLRPRLADATGAGGADRPRDR